jgi:DNA-binding NarL/FixJ family response regulator
VPAFWPISIDPPLTMIYPGLGYGQLTDASFDRERQVLHLLSKGLMYKEIADKLGISIALCAPITKIYEALHVPSRAEAMLKYFGRKPMEQPSRGLPEQGGRLSLFSAQTGNY